MRYRAIVIDPPWQQETITGFTKTRNKRPKVLPYPTMSLEQIASLPIPELAADNAHLWLWTTNRFLPDGFDLMKQWGFKYMLPVHWIKPSGLGAWWVHRSQTLLFGYRGKLEMKSKFHPNLLHASARRHSEKPSCSYDLIEAVSHEPYLELFARRARPGWSVLGDGIDGRDIFASTTDLIRAG